MAVNCFSARRLNELIVTAAPVWWRKALAFFTLYDELSAARTLEEFLAVRVRLQREWIFNAGFVSRFCLFFFFFLLIPC